MNRWNSKFAGTIAGSKSFHKKENRNTCIYIGFQGRTLKAHRVILKMNGVSLPQDKVVDHINRDPFDNRLENLRLVSPQENAWNSSPKKRSQNLPAGVTLTLNKSKFISRLKVNKKHIHLGVFDTPEEAHKRYLLEKERRHFIQSNQREKLAFLWSPELPINAGGAE